MKLLPKSFLKALQLIVGNKACLTDSADCWLYSYDNGRHRGLAQAVVFPETTQQISQIIKRCYCHKIPVIARGRGTGTPGGAVPANGGVVLSLEKMHQILKLDAPNQFIKVQAGILNQTVQDAVQSEGFFWAPDPSSSAFCTVGGNIGYNAGGPRAVKYGATREHVLGLTAVTGTGDIIHTGSYTSKGSVGYDLTRLLIGSEGTLAVITEAILKLTPLPSAKNTVRVLYQNIDSAMTAVIHLMAQPDVPCALEFLDDACVRLISKNRQIMPEHFSHTYPSACMLLIDLEFNLDEHNNTVLNSLKNIGLIDICLAKNETERKSLWLARKTLSQQLKSLSPKKISEDVVVPVTAAPELLNFLKKISQQYDLPIVNFGHAGNGNIHVNLLMNPEINAHHTDRLIDQCLQQIFDQVIKLNGTLSGEHGIGLEKKPFMSKAVSAETLQLMRNIKTVFDPGNILNPCKIFPEI